MKERRSFYRNNQTIKFACGETIFFQDMVPKCIYVIKSGVVEEFDITCTGDSRSISFETVGDVIPKCFAFSKTERTLFNYVAHTDCELYIVSKNAFGRELGHDVEFANKMINRLMNSLMSARLHIDAISRPKAHMKLLYTFRFLALLYGKEVGEGLVRIQIPLTQQTIANITGLTRETASLGLHKIKSQGVVDCKSKYYVVNIGQLHEQIEDEYDPGVVVGEVRGVVRGREVGNTK